MTLQLWKVGVVSFALLACGAGSVQAEGTPGHVDGVGAIWVPESKEHPAGVKLFEPTHVDATASSKPARVWLLLTDRDASGVAWRTAADRSDALRDWCKREAASFVLFEFDRMGAPEMFYECGGSGALRSGMISVINGLATVTPTFELFDGKRIRGRIESGEGWCGEETYCTKNVDFMVDVEVLP